MAAPRIRPAVPGDEHGIATVHVASWRAAYRGLMPDEFLAALSIDRRQRYWKDFLEGRAEPEGRAWVAEEGPSIVGFASSGINRDDDLPSGTPELFAIYLDESVWGRGIGRALVEIVKEDWRQRGIPRAVLWVLEGNERTRRFYEAGGWRTDGGKEWLDDMNAYKVRYALDLAGAEKPPSTMGPR